MCIAISFFLCFDPGTASHISLSTIIGTDGPMGFHIYLNTNSMELRNLARGLQEISSLISCHQRDIGINFLIWMIISSLFHICLVYQLMNWWMCLKLLDLL